MAAKPLPEQAKAFAGKLVAAIPFLKRRLPGGGRAAEPFDSIEDDSSGGLDDFGPNAAPDIQQAGRKSGKTAASKEARGEALKAFFEAMVRNKLVLGLAFGFLILVIAICVAAIIVSAPPEAGTTAGTVTPEGTAILQRLILPGLPGLGAEIELEREPDKVYTAEDAGPFLTDPASVDISDLEARNQAEMENFYRTVP